MIVVDTNVLVHFCLVGPQSEAARQWAREEPEWRAPTLWRSELQNVLILKMRREEFPADLALQAMMDAEFQMRHRCDRVATADVLALVASGCTAYDLEFVALALQLQAPLITMDRQILRAFPRVARGLMPEAQS